MSRSYKQPILKDGCKSKNIIWRRVQKRSQKNYFKSNLSKVLLDDNFDLVIPDRRTIVNDYTLCDWIWSYNIPFTSTYGAKRWNGDGLKHYNEMKLKLSRK